MRYTPKILSRIVTLTVAFYTLPAVTYALPDLVINTAQISLSADRAETNQSITITVTVSNTGTDYGSQVYSSPYMDYTAYTSSDNAAIGEESWLAQYFFVSEDFYLGRVTVPIKNIGDTTDDIIMQIRTSAPGLFKPVEGFTTYLASKTLNYTLSTVSWVDFDFDTPVRLSEGNTYWLCMGSYSTIASTNNYTWGLELSAVPDMLAAGNGLGVNWSTVEDTPGTYAGFHTIYRTTSTTVHVYDGDPDAGGTLIHTESITTHIASGADTNFAFNLSFSSTGTHNIYVVIDEQNSITEISKLNNTAFKSMSITDTIPEVSSAEPAGGLVGVSVESTPRIIFSEPMDSSTINTGSIILEAIYNNLGETIRVSVPGSVSYDAAAYTAIFIPDAPLYPNYTYRLTISTAVKDEYIHPLDSAQTVVFTTAMSNTQDHIIRGSDSTTRIAIDAGSVPFDAFYFSIETDPPETDAMRAAQAKQTDGTVPFLVTIPNTIRTCSLYIGDYPGTLSGNALFSSPVSITIAYSDDGSGIVSGLTPPVREDTLVMYWLNEEDRIWVPLHNSRIDTANNLVTASISHFTTFALVGAYSSSLHNAYAYPVPFKPNDDPTHTTITFTGLSAQATIKIYTITGELIATIEETDGDGENDTWDARNIASGMYLYKIENGREQKNGQLLIIK